MAEMQQAVTFAVKGCRLDSWGMLDMLSGRDSGGVALQKEAMVRQALPAGMELLDAVASVGALVAGGMAASEAGGAGGSGVALAGISETGADDAGGCGVSSRQAGVCDAAEAQDGSGG